MVLTARQEKGLKTAVARYQAGEKYTCIAGYAGSGKSTLVKFIVSALHVEPESVAYCAYTGKAATVLKQKGCANAVTAHKLLYNSRRDKSGKYHYWPIQELKYKIVVVDEVSMLPKKMWDLLLRYDVYVLAMGDPFQLPPIDQDADNHVLDRPHVFLDEIMRQALDSEIIQLSMHIRQGKPLYTFPCKGEQVRIFSATDVTQEMLNWADQILCATNATRTSINDAMRAARGFPKEPQLGDKIISLNNHWDIYSDMGSPLTNGVIGNIVSMQRESLWVPHYVYSKPLEYLHTTFETEDNEFMESIPVDYCSLLNGKKQLNAKQEYLLEKNSKYIGAVAPYDFAYGYAITVHKAQGSEWEKVLVFEENFPHDNIEHARWLYTAATRASQKLVLIKK